MLAMFGYVILTAGHVNTPPKEKSHDERRQRNEEKGGA